ncbi:S-layer homology domain-containing protein [Cohnella soli]|uniref:S-layer homology domain-containing protein n=2 Tax=Cohnella soli TaxID=425005 RepID=A0ABW0HU28_9BACL
MAIGFNKGESEFWYDGQIWMNIRGNGAYEIYANGTAIPIGQGTSTAFIPNQMNKLKVSYDSSLKTVTAWVNNEQVVDHFSLGSFTPDIQYAGFMVTSGDVNVQRIDNFAVKGVRIPQPDTELPVAISDTFQQTDIDRVQGFPLIGTATEVGGRRWIGNESIVFAGSGADANVSSHSNWGHNLAIVPYVPSGPSMSVEADVSVTNMTSWMAIGFSKGTREFWYDGQVWMNLRSNGNLEVYVNGAKNPVFQGHATAFNESGYNKVKVEYNAANHTVTAWVNTEKVVDHYDISGIAGFTPDIRYAGFVFQDPTPLGQKVKNFIVKGEMQPLPPPKPLPTDIVPLKKSDFPIGVFGNMPTGNRELFQKTVADLYSKGFDSYYAVNGSLNQDVLDFDIADAYGMGLYYNPMINLRNFIQKTSAPDDAQKAQDIARMLKARLEGHSSVRSVILSDEPRMDTMAKHVLMTDAIHAEMPDMKVLSPVIGIGTVSEMYSAINLDAFMIDVYPYSVKNAFGDITMNGYGYTEWDFISYIRKVTETKQADQPLWVILQAHTFDSGGRFSLRSPLRSELRMQNWMSIGEGATGIFWFLYETPPNGNVTGFQDHPELYDEASQLANRVKPLRDKLLAAKKDKDRFTASASGNVKPYTSTLVSKDGTKTYVVAVNMDAEHPQSLTVQSTQYEGTLKDLETGQEYTLGSSAIPFVAGDGKLFELIPSQNHNEPVVVLTSPSQDAVYSGASPTVHLTADVGTGISRVEFFANGKKVGTALQAPYQATWLHAPSGGYTITAVATDSRGTSNSSASVSITVQGTDNLLKNGSFEVENGDWTEGLLSQSASLDYDSTVARTGGKSIKMTGIAAQSVLSQGVALQPNTDYELSAWVKTNQIRGSGISIQCIQSGITTMMDYAPFPVFGTKDWTRIEVSFTTPAVVSPSKVEIYMNSLMDGGTAWIDDISLIETGKKANNDGLEAHWAFDEGNGQITLDSASKSSPQKVGTIVGGIWVPASLTGKFGTNSIFMYGGSQYIETPAIDLTNWTGFTISSWIELESVEKRQIIYANGGIVLEVAAGGRFDAKMRTGDPEVPWTTIQGGQLKAGKWVHVAVTYGSSGGIQLYIDGVQVGQHNPVIYLHDGSLSDYIGGAANETGASLHGLIDDVRVYSRTLSEVELKQLAHIATQATPHTDLSELTVSTGSLNPVFDPKVTSYSVKVGHETASLTITPTTSFPSSTITVLGQVYGSGTPIEVKLSVGINTVPLLITDLNGAMKTYTVVIQRAASGNGNGNGNGNGSDNNESGNNNPGQSSSNVKITDIVKHWAQESIERAIADGWVKGYEDQTFRPNQGTTRAEFISLLFRVLRPNDTVIGDVLNGFPDGNKVGTWARDAIAYAINAGWIVGDSGNNIQPNRMITRAEMAVILARVLNLPRVGGDVSVSADDSQIPKWAKDQVYALIQAGLIVGTGKGSFAPFKQLSRAEAVVVLLRMQEWLAAKN